jgi:hypothetical protein
VRSRPRHALATLAVGDSLGLQAYTRGGMSPAFFHPLVMGAEKTIQRASGGQRVDPWLGEGVQDGGSPTPCALVA